MKLKKFKERDNKRIGIIVFTLVCILLVSGVILYRTFAIFEVKTTQNVIKGTVQDPGNIYFAFYVDDEIQKDMPQKNGEYIFDEENSYCGVTGENEHDDSIKLEFDKDRWSITVVGLKTSRTKCNLKFVSGAYILDKPVKAVTSGDGLYKVTHGDEVSGTLNDDGFKQTEWRYAGANPNNYVKFNEEKWRIIGLVNVMTSDNHVEQRVKIIRNDSIQNVQWNEQINVNDWNKASLMRLLNTEDYYNRRNNYETIGLTENAKEKIDENITWNLGGYNDSNITTNDIYKYERSNNVFEGNNYLWQTYNHGVALMYPSDYGYAVGGTNENRTKCIIQTYINNYDTCTSENWLYLTNEYDYEWLLTHNTWKDSNHIHTFVYEIAKKSNNGGNGKITAAQFDVSYTSGTSQFRPTLYLKTNVKIIKDDNNGSEGKPFILQQV